MCIAFISDAYARIDLLIEKIFISTEGGILRAHEVYDAFFVPTRDWEKGKILCISPHNLLNNNKLMVRTSNVPGAGGPDDAFFADPVLSGEHYDVTKKTFSINLPASQGTYALDSSTVKGSVVVPQIQLPKVLSDDQLAREFMAECGTTFELHMDNLERDKRYVFRLIADPVKLLGLPRRRSEDMLKVDKVLSRWLQDATIMCPRTCRFNYLAMISMVKNLKDYVETVTTIETLIKNDRFTMMPVLRHQIVLILPVDAELSGSASEGCAWPASKHTLSDGRLASNWIAGTSQYWRDEPELAARKIYKYFTSLTENKERTKKDVSTAVDLSIDNCALILSAMRKFGMLKSVKRGQYRAISKSKDKLEEIFKKVAGSVANEFKWRGYQIRFSVRYRWLSAKDQQLLDEQNTQREKAYNFGRIGLISGLLSISVTIIVLLVRLLIFIGRYYFSDFAN